MFGALFKVVTVVVITDENNTLRECIFSQTVFIYVSIFCMK